MSGTTYDLAEIGTYTGRDVRLYRFQLGEAKWFYNSGDRDLDWNGVTWFSVPVSDDGLKQKGEATTDDFTVTMPSTTAVVALFRSTPPSQPIKVTLRQLQFGDVVAPIMWVGYVSSVRYRDPASSDIICNTQTAFLNRKGLRLSWTRGCPYVLYDDDCGVVKEAWAEAATITRLFGNGFDYALVSDPSPARWEFRFRNGFIEWSPNTLFTSRRAIISDTNSTCLIIGQTDDMTVGMSVTMFPGCTRTPQGCKDFDNVPNYGGFQTMPGKSPFNGNPVF